MQCRIVCIGTTKIAAPQWLFGVWAGICTRALADLKAASPIPKDLKPMQRL